MSGGCSETVGKGAVEYQCEGQQGHPEPHWSRSVGATMVKRSQWFKQNRQDSSVEEAEEPPAESSPPPAPVAPEPSVASVEETPGASADVSFRSHDDRLSAALNYLHAPADQLTPVLDAWVKNAMCQMALLELWNASADGPIVLDRATLSGLIPTYLQS